MLSSLAGILMSQLKRSVEPSDRRTGLATKCTGWSLRQFFRSIFKRASAAIISAVYESVTKKKQDDLKRVWYYTRARDSANPESRIERRITNSAAGFAESNRTAIRRRPASPNRTTNEPGERGGMSTPLGWRSFRAPCASSAGPRVEGRGRGT